MQGWKSPRLGVRFEMDSGELRLYGPDGKPFATYVELYQQVGGERQRAEQERQRAERLAAQLAALGAKPQE
jgi:hypothetical protein